jgi:hypothetical protein
MPKRIDQLNDRTPVNNDWVVSTITSGPATRSRLYQLIRNGLDQSVDTGGNSLPIIAPERTVTGSGGHILLAPGKKPGGPGTAPSDYYGRIYLVASGGVSPTNADFYFAFDTDKVLLVSGQTGSGKSILLQSGTATLCSVHIGQSLSSGPATAIVGPLISNGLFVNGQGVFQEDFSSFDVVNPKLLWPRKVSTLATSGSGAPDVGIERAAKGILKVTDGSTGGGSFSSPSTTLTLAGVNVTSTTTLTGIASPTSGSHADGRKVSLFNVGTANLLVSSNDVDSVAANRLKLNVSVTIVPASTSLDLTYDSAASRWVVSGGSAGSSGAQGADGAVQYASAGFLAGATGVFTNGSDLRVQGPLLTGSTNTRCGLYVVHKLTQSATLEKLTTDGQAVTGSNQVILPDNATYLFDILVSAQREDTIGERAAFRFEGVAFRNTGAATVDILIGGVSKTSISKSEVPWDVSIATDTTNGAISIQVTGESAKSIRWVAAVKTVEVRRAN